MTWTIDRARKAGLTSNSTWAKYPAAMLTARAVYPACLSGIITEDEAVEITAAPFERPKGAEPVTLTATPEPVPATRDYIIADGERYAAPTRRVRKSGNGSKHQPPTFETATPEPVVAAEPQTAPSPGAEPAQHLEGEFTREPESKSLSPHVGALYHPLDPVLAELYQDKLTAFLLKQGFRVSFNRGRTTNGADPTPPAASSTKCLPQGRRLRGRTRPLGNPR